MFNITNYLKRFSSIIQSEKVGKAEIIEVISKTISYTLPEGAITIKGDTVFITAPSVVKSEIMLHGAKIILRIKEKNPTTKIKVLR